MIEIVAQPPATLIALTLWDSVAVIALDLPAPGYARDGPEGRVLWWEPNTYLVRARSAEGGMAMTRLTQTIGAAGAITDLSGAFSRFRLSGPSWRELLMIGGVFDAEAPAFGPGRVVGTILHHIAVRLDVLEDDTVEAYVPPSYAASLHGHWTRWEQRRSEAV